MLISSGRARPSGGHRRHAPWAWLGIVSVNGFLLIGGMLTSLTVYASVMQRHFGWSEAAMGGGPVALLLGMSAGNLLVGAAMRRLGLRGTFSLGTAIAATGWIAAGFTRSLAPFAVAMAGAGFGVGMATIVPGIALISETFHERKGLAIALFIGACALASFTMPILTGTLIAWLGWRAAFWTVGGVSGLICLALLRRLPQKPGDMPASSTAATKTAPAGPSQRQVAAMTGYWMLVLGLTLSQLGMNGVLFNVIAYLQKNGYAATDAIRIYGIANLMSLPGLLIGGYISDRIDGRIILPAVLALQTAGTAMLLGVGTGSWNKLAVAGFIAIWGSVSGLPAQSGAMVLNEMIGQRAYPAMLGILFTIAGVVGALAPILMGWLYMATGGYTWPITMLALLALLAMLAVLASSRGAPPRTAALPSPAP